VLDIEKMGKLGIPLKFAKGEALHEEFADNPS